LRDALQVGEQHLDALALTPRLLEGRSFGEGPGKVAGVFMQAARDLANQRIGAASHFEPAGAAVQGASAVEQRRTVVHQRAARNEGLPCRTSIEIAVVIIAEVLSREGAVPGALTCR
jgi:hypothetical protein